MDCCVTHCDWVMSLTKISTNSLTRRTEEDTTEGWWMTSRSLIQAYTAKQNLESTKLLSKVERKLIYIFRWMKNKSIRLLIWWFLNMLNTKVKTSLRWLNKWSLNALRKKGLNNRNLKLKSKINRRLSANLSIRYFIILMKG